MKTLASRTLEAGVVKFPGKNVSAMSGWQVRPVCGFSAVAYNVHQDPIFVSNFDSMTHRGLLTVEATPARLSRRPGLVVWRERLRPIAKGSAPFVHD